MKVELNLISIRDLTRGYENNLEDGVYGYGSKLNIRPPYQREFIYSQKQQIEVIKTINKGFPLNVLYWAVNGEEYEVIDGQQRTMSICEYVKGNFMVDGKYFYNLPQDKKDRILDYTLTIYFCTGSESAKLDWFKTINIAGEELNNQELRNAVYTGEWLNDAKKKFSQTNCPAYKVGGDFMKGQTIRQDYLETALKWISDNDIEGYMAEYQKEPNANALWIYFNSVMGWVRTIFPDYRKEMKGLRWGEWYNIYKDTPYDTANMEEKVTELMKDEDVTKKSGIYLYLLSGDEKHLNIRQFSARQKREVFERQKGVCPQCGGETYRIGEMEADHIIPWSKGGKTEVSNCQLLCKKHNREKSNK